MRIFQDLTLKIQLLVLKEFDAGKEDIASELIKKVPRPPVVDFAIRKR